MSRRARTPAARRASLPEIPYLINSQPGPLHRAVLGFAHRGADEAAENTEAAFARAVDQGYRYIETDVRTSADGHLVLFHDATLDRVTDSTGSLQDKTWEELSRVRVGGEPLMRFDHALERFPEAHFNVDLKDRRAIAPFVKIVRQYGAQQRVLVASFSDRRRRAAVRGLQYAVAASPGLIGTAVVWAGARCGILPLIKRMRLIGPAVCCVQVPVRYGRVRVVTARFVRQCHRAGLQVHVWGVDDPALMRSLVQLGVDGLMTDDGPELAAALGDLTRWPQ